MTLRKQHDVRQPPSLVELPPPSEPLHPGSTVCLNPAPMPGGGEMELEVGKLLRAGPVPSSAVHIYRRGLASPASPGWILSHDGAPKRSLLSERAFNPFTKPCYLEPGTPTCYLAAHIREEDLFDLDLPQRRDCALLLIVKWERALLGLAWLERHTADRPFTAEDCSALEGILPWLLVGVRACSQTAHRLLELTALRALSPHHFHLVVDLETRQVIWVGGDEKDWSIRSMSTQHSGALVQAAEHFLARRAGADTARVSPCPPLGTITAVSLVAGPQRQPWAVIGLAKGTDLDRLATLSRQERIVADFLLEGRAAGDIALLCNLSEHTVRTYIRRIYKKLDVYNRAQLVKMLCAPQS